MIQDRFKLSKKMIGIEIGSDTLKLAVCVGDAVAEMAVKRLPENLIREGRVTAPTALTNFVKDMLKEYGIRPGPCAFVLPPQVVIAHHVTMPNMSEQELKLNLPFEFRDFVGKDAEKYEYDYSVVRVNDKTIDLYAAAVPKDVVESYYDIFKKAGLTMKVAIPHEMAWLNLVVRAKNEPKCLAIVDVGQHATRVDIFLDDNYIMGKDIEIGGQLFDEAIASNQRIDAYVARSRKEANMDNVLALDCCSDVAANIAVEVMKVVAFYNNTYADEGNKLTDIYYCGGSSVIESLRTAILKNTNLTMHNVRRLVGLHGDDSALPLSCAIAVGAAVQQ